MSPGCILLLVNRHKQMTTRPDSNLSEVINETSVRYYALLDKLCDNINTCLEISENKLHVTELISHSSSLATEVRLFVEERKNVYIPYLQELSEKSRTGHDCANCSGNCDMQHTLRLIEFAASLKKVQNTSAYIQQEFDALYNEEMDSIVLWLKNAADLMVILLDALSVQEESSLIPAIQYAQKNINAHS